MNWQYKHMELPRCWIDQWVLCSGLLRLTVTCSGDNGTLCSDEAGWLVAIDDCVVGDGYCNSPDEAKAKAVDDAKRLLTEMLSGLEG